MQEQLDDVKRLLKEADDKWSATYKAAREKIDELNEKSTTLKDELIAAMEEAKSEELARKKAEGEVASLERQLREAKDECERVTLEKCNADIEHAHQMDASAAGFKSIGSLILGTELTDTEWLTDLATVLRIPPVTSDDVEVPVWNLVPLEEVTNQVLPSIGFACVALLQAVKTGTEATLCHIVSYLAGQLAKEKSVCVSLVGFVLVRAVRRVGLRRDAGLLSTAIAMAVQTAARFAALSEVEEALKEQVERLKGTKTPVASIPNSISCPFPSLINPHAVCDAHGVLLVHPEGGQLGILPGEPAQGSKPWVIIEFASHRISLVPRNSHIRLRYIAPHRVINIEVGGRQLIKEQYLDSAADYTI
jgi:hypothetical protein